ncbi:MAG: glycosyltransferase family 2 protein [Cyanobacteria bacterium P01_A01_bin.114]
MSVYNGEAHIDKAIPSILSQTYEAFEFIIIDDGSTDRTGERLQAIAKQDVRVKIHSPGRLGLVKALNYGIEQAQGKYIVRQDIDDISLPNRLSSQVAYLDRHPQAGLVGGFYKLIDESRQENYIRMPPTEHSQILRMMTKCIPVCNTIATLRKQAWEEAGRYQIDDGLEDLRLMLALAQKNWQIANLPEVLGEHRVYSESFWHRNTQYKTRQNTLAKLQYQAVQTLDLPFWLSIYPLSRLAYGYLPTALKKFARRNLIGMQEKDISPG